MVKAGSVHLVGSFPAPDAYTAFHKCAQIAQSRLARIPDGEPGVRNNFTIGPVMQKIQEYPELASTWRKYDEKFDPVETDKLPEEEIENLQMQLKSKDWKLGYDVDAVVSYETLGKLKAADEVGKDVKFQVCIPGASSVGIFARPEFSTAVEEKWFQTTAKELTNLQTKIPARELAVQFDIASDLIKSVAQKDADLMSTLRVDFHPQQQNALDYYVKQYAQIVKYVNPAAELGFHICLGNINNKAIIQPKDMSVMVSMANELAKAVDRDINWIHFGCLSSWQDPSDFAPLAHLALKPSTKVYLGVVHPENDTAGDERQIKAASQSLQGFGFASPCGLARCSDELAADVLKRIVTYADRSEN